MPGERQSPWGIIVTRTCHLVTRTCHLVTVGRGLDPACHNEQVKRTMEGLRRRYRTGDRDASPIFGPAGNRRVCRRCIRAMDRMADRASEQADAGRAWNGES